MAILPNGPRSGSLRMPSYLRTLAAALAACGSLSASPYPDHARSGQPRAATVQAQPSPLEAPASAGKELARPARPKHHAAPRDRPADAKPARAVAPQGDAPLSEPTEPEQRRMEQSSDPEDEGEVSPGDDPASCEGCELAILSLGGTLWGLFGVARRRGIPRTVIRGLQPR